MKMSIVTKVYVLVLSLSFALLTSSYARNDQNGGHSSGVAHYGGGHAGGRGGAVRVAHGRSFAGYSNGHVTRVEHSAGTGAAPARQTANRGSMHRELPGRAQSTARGSQKAAAPQQPVNGNRTLAVDQPTPRNGAGTHSSAGTANTSRASLAAAIARNDGNWSRDQSAQWHQAVANRRASWNRWTNENRGQLQRFQATRNSQLSHVAGWWNGKNVAQTMHSDPWNAYRDGVANFRNGRRIEIWNGAQWYHDNLFDNRWWAGCGWYPSVAVGYWDPWWWWRPCDWPSFTFFLGWGYPAPLYYDCGVNWVDDSQSVYFDGQPIGSSSDCANWAAQLADPPNLPGAPTPPGDDQNADWKPLGAWALTQEDKGDAFMFVQLTVNKSGVISGAYANVLSGEKEPVVGRIDQATQRVAFRFGETKTTVIETGAYNLTQDVASCFVRFGTGPAQTWLMVRLPAPTLPNAPTRLSEQPKTSGGSG